MHRFARNFFGTLIRAALIFLAGYSIEIAVDVWMVNHPSPTDRFAHRAGVPVTHIRQYILPVAGFALSVFLFLRRAAPAGRDAIGLIEARGAIGEAFRPTVRSLAWTVAAIAAFQAAIWLQRGLFGFFLPP
jgi:hypothetical protein